MAGRFFQSLSLGVAISVIRFFLKANRQGYFQNRVPPIFSRKAIDRSCRWFCLINDDSKKGLFQEGANFRHVSTR